MQLPPVLLASMLLVTVAVPSSAPVCKIAPPAAAKGPRTLLPAKVQLITVSVPALEMAPPSDALLLKKVLLATAKLLKPSAAIAPPKPSLRLPTPLALQEKVQSVTVKVLPVQMAPPPLVPPPRPGPTLLPKKVLLTTVP